VLDRCAGGDRGAWTTSRGTVGAPQTPTSGVAVAAASRAVVSSAPHTHFRGAALVPLVRLMSTPPMSSKHGFLGLSSGDRGVSTADEAISETPNLWRSCHVFDTSSAGVQPHQDVRRSVPPDAASISAMRASRGFDGRESPLQNDGNTPVSVSTVRAKLNLSTAANVTETREKNSRAQYRNGVDVQSCVPDSPQVLLKPLRIGLCLFTARRPLS
jgi:hypothetical protein